MMQTLIVSLVLNGLASHFPHTLCIRHSLTDSPPKDFLQNENVYFLTGTINIRWIGATDSLSDGIWRWVPSGAIVDYSNWYPGQPATGDYYNCAAWTPVYDYWDTDGCYDHDHYPLCETMPL